MVPQVSQQSLFEAASAAEEERMPWDRIVFLTADIHYGGRVTDQVDQRLLASLLKRCFSAADIESHVADPLLRGYVLPSDYGYEDMTEFAMCLPADTAPQILGLDPGAALVYVSTELEEGGIKLAVLTDFQNVLTFSLFTRSLGSIICFYASGTRRCRAVDF